MKNSKVSSIISYKCLVLLVLGLISLKGLHAAPQDVDLTIENDEYVFSFGMDQIPPGTGFGVINAAGNVTWSFNSTPTGATESGNSFSFEGITVTLPGNPNESVDNSMTASIEGTSTSPGSFTFTVLVTDENNNKLSETRQYTLKFSPEMDMVLVMDRSGSMGLKTSTGNTRWEALKDAVAN